MVAITPGAAVIRRPGPPGIDGRTNYQRAVDLLGFAGTEQDYLASLHGRPGADGTDGIGIEATATAAVDIPPETMVVDRGDGTCAPADPSNPSHCGRVLGFCKAGGLSNGPVVYRTLGPVSGLSTVYADGIPLFISDGTGSVHLGGLTTVPQTLDGRWHQQIATGSGSGIVIALGEAGLLDDGLALTLSYADVLVYGRRLVADVDYQMVADDATIVMGARTASRTVTLCSETAFPPGQEVCIFDGSGQADTFPLTIATKPGERIVMSGDPMADRGAIALNAAFGRYSLKAVGGGTWSLKAE